MRFFAAPTVSVNIRLNIMFKFVFCTKWLTSREENASFFSFLLWQNLPHKEVLVKTWNVWHKDAESATKTINNKIIMKKEETTAQKSPGSAWAFFYLFWADF